MSVFPWIILLGAREFREKYVALVRNFQLEKRLVVVFEVNFAFGGLAEEDYVGVTCMVAAPHVQVAKSKAFLHYKR